MKWFVCLLGLVLVASCTSSSVKPPVFRFEPWGLQIEDLPPHSTLKLFDAKGHLLLAYPPFAAEEEMLFFRWQPGARYRVVIKGKSYEIKAPARPLVVRLKIFAPLGQRPYEIWLEDGQSSLTLPILDLAGEEACQEVGLLLENVAQIPLRVDFAGEKALLKGEFARKFFVRRLCFTGKEIKELPLNLTGPVDLKVSLRFQFRKVALSRAISLKAWRLPTDAFGFIEQHRLEGTLVAPNPFWQKLGYALGIKAKGFSRYDPFAYETLILENHLNMPLTLLLKADFLDLKTKRPVSGFYPKRFSEHGFKQPLALIDLPPQGEAKAVLPIFLDKGIPPGEYQAVVTVYPFGSKKPILIFRRHIGVVRGKVSLSLALLVVLILGSGYSLFVLLNLKRMIRRFRLRELTLIALTGAVGFGLDFLGGVASNILYALFGPFNILVGGLVTEVAHYLVLTAVLYLIPQTGVITLSGVITYLMGGFLFGGFRITDPFFVGTRLFVLEMALILFGTVGHGRPSVWPLVLALSLADAINTAVSLLLHMTFFRLFFPGWYILLSLVVKGFIYTLIGAYLGARVGKILIRVER